MTRVRRPALAAAVALLAGCGNYSTEDLRFLVALPTRADLRVAPPAGGGASAAGATVDAAAAVSCANGTADVWLWAKPTSDGLNAGVDFVLSLVDVVRRITPSARERDARRWGPFPADRHPGREIQVVMVRSFPYGSDARPLHTYRFEARIVGAGAFEPVIVGSFDGASARRGRGQVTLDFQKMWDLGINDAGTPHGQMDIVYDRASDPVTIDLGLSQQGFGVEQFGYGYAGYGDGRGRFDYRLRNTTTNDLLTVTTAYAASGAGRARVRYEAGTGAVGAYDECWDASACIAWLDDPAGFICGPGACTRGALSACVPVPEPAPFPAP